jgi:hypothetical protein
MTLSTLIRTALLTTLLSSAPAWAVHECPTGMSTEACDVCTELATDLCVEDAATQYNLCAELWGAAPALVELICQPELSNDMSDCTQHLGDFDFDGAIVALDDLGECDGGGTIEDLCPCTDDWANHGKYVSCVSQAANTLVADGVLTAGERKDTVRAAARSQCGK